MHGKEFILDCLRTYFIVVTMINFVMYLLGISLMPEKRFGYEAFAAPLIYGLAGTLPELVMYSRHELKIKELIVRKIVQLLLVEALVLFVAFYDANESWIHSEAIGSVAVSILIIFVLTSAFDWLQNHLSAKRMNEELLKFQESVRQ